MMNDGDISGAQATVCEGLLEGSKDRELKALQVILFISCIDHKMLSTRLSSSSS